MKTRQELKMLAKEALREQRSVASLIMLVFLLKLLALGVFNDIVIGGLGWFPLFVVNLLITLALIVLAVGLVREYLNIYRRRQTHVMALYGDFTNHYGHKLAGMLWMGLWVSVWALIAVPIVLLAVYLLRTTGRGWRLVVLALLGPVHLIALIPAIVKGLSYGMTPFILSDCPDVPAREALKLSMRMMAGHKKQLFLLALSFIGWHALSVLTLGILYVVYVGPYYYITLAGFYDEVRVRAITDGDGPPKNLCGTVSEADAEAEPEAAAVRADELAVVETQAELDALDAADGGNVEIRDTEDPAEGHEK